MTFQKNIIKHCKYLIDVFDLDGIKKYYLELTNTEFDYDINIGHIFKTIFFYSCKKGNKPIIKWMIELYNTFDETTKIALRQMFFYGKYVIIRNKHKELAKWYDKHVLPPIRCK